MHTVVVALNAFKESMTAPQACRVMADGFLAGNHQTDCVVFPVADGGDGTAAAFVAATNGRFVNRTVTGPLGDPVRARYGILGDGETAIVEMATASGLALVPPAKRNPSKTTTFGTGELIADALDRGVKRVIVGLGGSATVDMGVGMAQALGAKLLDGEGKPVPRGGRGLARIETIDLTELRSRLGEVEVIAATDVTNPLLGKKGGIQVYSPQKGASPTLVERLEEGAAHAAKRIQDILGIDVVEIPGSGAAGGFGAGIVAWLGGTLRPGIEVLLDAAHFDDVLEGASLVITGEGRIDAQTAFGKAPAGVGRRALKAGVPCIAIAGSYDRENCDLRTCGIEAVFSICNEPMSLAYALKNARKLAFRTAEQIGRLWILAPWVTAKVNLSDE